MFTISSLYGKLDKRAIRFKKVCLYEKINNYITMTKSWGGDILEVQGRCFLRVMTEILSEVD